ncbi:MAG TPA: molybdopterin-dependent oxidoreductase, partial [Candidatus Deferrimicrobiaceae bacterium]|nr:molybdopterin-dependent oxidoreductase [Candidatus Deferrimicrobiaceae bacterium]
GALTSKDFRFKCRVWFLRGTRSICPGCANGCNVEAHFKEDIVYRLMPRRNDDVNRTWMCDPGRLEYKKANEARLLTPVVRENGGLKAEAWEAALSFAAFRLWETVEAHGAASVAVIASPAFSNEELYLARKLAEEVLRTPNVGFSPRSSGNGLSDDFLIKADKNPNTRGAQLLGISEEKFDDIVRKIEGGEVKALLVFGNELADFPGERTAELLSRVPFVAQVGTNEGAVSLAAHAVLPSASFVERGGTFTNHAGRVQRFWMGFPPRGNARGGIEILVGLANRLGAGWTFAGEASVFRAIARSEAPFAGMSYESLGELGQIAGGKG